jgi:hypothetical protein
MRTHSKITQHEEEAAHHGTLSADSNTNMFLSLNIQKDCDGKDSTNTSDCLTMHYLLLRR